MDTVIKYKPESVTHPGGSLSDFIEDKGMVYSEFAKKIGVDSSIIEDIVNEKASIKKRTAKKIEKVFGSPADFWIRRQNRYADYIREEKKWSRKFPLNKLAERGYLPKKESSFKGLHDVFDTYNYNDWKSHVDEKQQALFRISETAKKDKYAICTWLRIGEIEAKSLSPKVAETFCLDKFKDALPAAKDLMARHPQDLLKKLQKLCADAGVFLIYTPALPKVPIKGAIRWPEDRPLMQLSLKGTWNDIFWFTFFHEAGHVVLDHDKSVSYISFEDEEANDDKEKEADKFAEQWMLTGEEMEQVKALWRSQEDKKKQKIIGLAKEFNTHPGVIIGRMQKEKIVDYKFTWANELKKPLDPERFKKKGSCILI